MLRVALTGGIASGKSAVAGMLRARGAYVSQSDEVARQMMRAGQPLVQQIVDCFGPAVIAPDGELNRQELARLAFEEGQLPALNALVHPAVLTAQASWLAQVGEGDPRAIAVIESALVLETPYQPAGMPANAPWRTCFDSIVVVSAPDSLRQQRYEQRLNSDTAEGKQSAAREYRQRAAAQWTDAQRERFADYLIRNDGSLTQLEAQVAELYDSLRAVEGEVFTAAS